MLLILLVRAGIDQNPVLLYGAVGQNIIHHRSITERCNGCVHFRYCSGSSDRNYVSSCWNIVVPSVSTSSTSTSESSLEYGTPPQSPKLQPLPQHLTPHVLFQFRTVHHCWNSIATYFEVKLMRLIMNRRNILIAAVQRGNGYNILGKDRTRSGCGG